MENKTKAIISADALRHNFERIRRHTKENTPPGRKEPEVICVVKANAYGHSAEIATQILGDAGCRFFAVSSEREAIQVREWEEKRGRNPAILILGYTIPANVPELVENRILCAAVSKEHALAMADAAEQAGCGPLSIHIKLDTGMNRVGFPTDEADAESSADAIAALAEDPRLRVCGLFTHFSCCDDEKMDGLQPCGEVCLTDLQWKRYVHMRTLLAERKVEIPFCHASNSAASLAFPESYLDGVRAGIALYGYSPDGQLREELDLRPVMRLETTVGHIHRLRPGERVSYGAEYTAAEERTVATLTVGYGDGFLRSYRTAHVQIGGRKFPLIGRICMDQCMADITGAEDLVHPGDKAVLFGGDRGESLLNLSACARTIPYESLCVITERVERALE